MIGKYISMIVELEWERTSPWPLLMKCQDRFKLQTGTTSSNELSISIYDCEEETLNGKAKW